MAKQKKPSSKSKTKGAAPGKPRLYTLEVFLIGGNITKYFAKKNRTVSRTVQIRGDQTLEDLHNAIFEAFDRFDPHMYEFQFGKGPMDPEGQRYVLPEALAFDMGEENRPAGTVDQATLDSLGLTTESQFGYWFDFGDDWWHQINVEAIDDESNSRKFPKIIKRVGASPPQYPEEDEQDEQE